MTAASMEAKKHGLRQDKDGIWIMSLVIHPNDMPAWLLQASMGQRLGVAIVPIEDEQDQEQGRAGAPVASPPPAPDAATPGGEQPHGADGASKTRKRWADLPVAQRAALICSDPRAWPVIEGITRWEISDENGAADAMRLYCNIHSRADLARNLEAQTRFLRIETDYLAAVGRIARPA